MSEALILCTWTGEEMVPLARFRKACDAAFTIGETYRLEVHELRSAASHSHYFACLSDAWANLREGEDERFPTPEHLRKWALIKAGYRDERSFVCASKAEALRFGAFMRPMDEHAVIVISETVVRVWTAQSQSKRAMGAKVFQASKQAVLDVVAGMIEVTPRALAEAAGKAA